jgi:MFS transporter, ACS family, glucarate transporter
VTAIMLRYGWRASFWFSALIGVVVGLVWYVATRNTPEEHWLVGPEEAALIREGRLVPGVAAVDQSVRLGDRKVPWSKIFTNKAVVAVTLSYFAYGYVAWIFFAWFYTYLAQVRGLNLKTSAIYSTLPFIAMTLGSLLGGVVSDWIAKGRGLRLGRCLLPGLSLAITAVLLVLGSRARGAPMAAVILACGAGILYVAQSGFWAVTADVAGEYVGVVSAIMNMGGQVGGACTTSLTPLIAAHFGWNMAFLTAASIALLGGLAWIVVDPVRDVLVARGTDS